MIHSVVIKIALTSWSSVFQVLPASKYWESSKYRWYSHRFVCFLLPKKTRQYKDKIECSIIGPHNMLTIRLRSRNWRPLTKPHMSLKCSLWNTLHYCSNVRQCSPPISAHTSGYTHHPVCRVYTTVLKWVFISYSLLRFQCQVHTPRAVEILKIADSQEPGMHSSRTVVYSPS